MTRYVDPALPPRLLVGVFLGAFVATVAVHLWRLVRDARS